MTAEALQKSTFAKTVVNPFNKSVQGERAWTLTKVDFIWEE